jgi:hypothetical protein
MRQGKTLRFARIGVGTILLAVLFYLLSSTLRVAGGISRVSDSPAHMVRLQVVNGSGVEGLAKRVAERLSGYSDCDLEVKVVEVVDCSQRRLVKTFVVSRDQDKTATCMLAEKIGLKPSEAVLQPLEHNRLHVSATLVLGEDYEMMTLPKTFVEEI